MSVLDDEKGTALYFFIKRVHAPLAGKQICHFYEFLTPTIRHCVARAANRPIELTCIVAVLQLAVIVVVVIVRRLLVGVVRGS